MKIGFALATALVVATACGSDNGPAPGGGQAGSACSSAAQCYPDVSEASAVKGTVECLTKVPGGYCTHTCTTDGDCCAVPGECRYNYLQVCATFENQPDQYCFLSCESADVSKAGFTDANAFCQRYASATFTCRSTGGGKPRKICSP